MSRKSLGLISSLAQRRGGWLSLTSEPACHCDHQQKPRRRLRREWPSWGWCPGVGVARRSSQAFATKIEEASSGYAPIGVWESSPPGTRASSGRPSQGRGAS